MFFTKTDRSFVEEILILIKLNLIMEQNTIVFDDTIAKNYDDLLGPFIFEPYAVDLVNRIDLRQVKNVLEIASGTGRVTKHLSEKLPLGAKLTATDLNLGMIALAAQRITNENIDWHTADMQALPFEDNVFDLVVCQFGIMFPPDRVKALKEIRRVLKPGGQLVFNTWGPIEQNHAWQITSEVVNSFMGNTASDTFRNGPFSLDNEKVVLELLHEAGFDDNNAVSVTLTSETLSAAGASKGFIEGLPILGVIKANVPQLLPAILEKLEKEFNKQLGEQLLKTRLNALVFISVK
jgi:ubiquinone/menaquinone biosynthesis C-methylase UbiE